MEIAGNEAAVSITLLDGARLLRALEPGEIVTEADVELPESLSPSRFTANQSDRAAPRPRALRRRLTPVRRIMSQAYLPQSAPCRWPGEPCSGRFEGHRVSCFCR